MLNLQKSGLETNSKAGSSANVKAETKAGKPKYTSVGGQALIEGIMMKGPNEEAIAVRKADGTIYTEKFSKPMDVWYRKTVFIRGIVNFFSQLVSGVKYLTMAADISGMLEDDETDGKDGDKADGKDGDKADGKDGDKADGKDGVKADGSDGVKADGKDGDKADSGNAGLLEVVMSIGALLGVLLFMVLFLFVPTYAFTAFESVISHNIQNLRSLFEGILRIIIFVAYMAATSLMKEIRVTYEYHGAEHKTIAAFEAKVPLTYENIKNYTRFHPRCGTSFVFLVLVISIVFYSVLPLNSETLAEYFGVSVDIGNILRVLLKIVLCPVLVGITYEVIRFAGKHDNAVTRAISAPGLLLQRLTTREPDERQVEIAVAALLEVLPDEERAGYEPSVSG